MTVVSDRWRGPIRRGDFIPPDPPERIFDKKKPGGGAAGGRAAVQSVSSRGTMKSTARPLAGVTSAQLARSNSATRVAPVG